MTNSRVSPKALYADSLVYGFSAWFTKVRALENNQCVCI